jgi:hypothetical protein
MKKDR